mmetsp:Transcript_11207/g.41058  ORF Transcript_11207/g.41058 Transcript_11207/m.41058 type:complete len:579 (+) Transcript_11207:111-1847(+)
MSVDDYQHNTLAQVSNLASITADLAVRRPDLNPVLPPKNTKAGGWFQQLKPLQKYLNAQTGEHVTVGKYTVYIRNQVAEGGYGVVFRCKEVGGQERSCALKRILIPEGEKEALAVAKREITALEELGSHSNIVQLLASSIQRHATKKGIIEVLVLMEWCRGGNMMEYAAKMKDMHIKDRELAVLRIFSDVVRAVAHLHMQEPPLQHRDLKPENYILAADGSWKLCDFGSSTREVLKCESRKDRLRAEDLAQRFTSATIRPPELWEIYEQTIDYKVDIWGLGCILYALAFGVMPFEGEKLAIVNLRYREPSEPAYSVRLWEMIRSMLSFDPKDRPAIGKICEWVATAIHLSWAEANPEMGAGLKQQRGELQYAVAGQMSHAAASADSVQPVSPPDDWNAFPEADEQPQQDVSEVAKREAPVTHGEMMAINHGKMNPIGKTKEPVSSNAAEPEGEAEGGSQEADQGDDQEEAEQSEGAHIESEEPGSEEAEPPVATLSEEAAADEAPELEAEDTTDCQDEDEATRVEGVDTETEAQPEDLPADESEESLPPDVTDVEASETEATSEASVPAQTDNEVGKG